MYDSMTYTMLVTQTSNVGSTIYGPIIAIAKLAILLQYKRLFVAHKRDFVFYGIHVLIWTNLLFYFIETFLEIFACSPREKIWNPLTPGTLGFLWELFLS